MTPVEIGRGKSFKGLAVYLLHDPRQEGEQARATTERVGWVQSYNLDGAGGEGAWRFMAATALSANALKQAAGIKIGPAPSSTAFHYSINLNPADRPSEEIERLAVEGCRQTSGARWC
ncbi:MAG: hypothetical protein DCF30_21125 [Hyphomicrobiales bacterium]|nr:MAG: hypothetical protein DCF30_21125 [Hyphomicrobiales bacterium]